MFQRKKNKTSFNINTVSPSFALLETPVEVFWLLSYYTFFRPEDDGQVTSDNTERQKESNNI